MEVQAVCSLHSVSGKHNNSLRLHSPTNRSQVLCRFGRYYVPGRDGHLPPNIVAIYSICRKIRRRSVWVCCRLELLRVRGNRESEGVPLEILDTDTL